MESEGKTSWWLLAPRDGFTKLGEQKAREASLDPVLDRWLSHFEAELAQTLKEGWIADPEHDDDDS